MSYILDALKRAEADRSRGAVPNIHAALAAAGASDRGRSAAARAAVAAVVAGAVVLCGVVGWRWWGGEIVPAPPVVTTTDHTSAEPQPAPSTPERLPAPAVSTVPSMRASEPTQSVVPARPLPPDAVPVPAPRLRSAGPEIAATPRAAGGRKPAAEPITTSVVPAGSVASVPEATAAERIYALRELPDEIRSALPALTVGGATYSESPANRMLIVNGSLYHEGDKVTPDVTLQQIKLRSAVLSYRGYRYLITY